jgi:hypothetical protein
LYMVQQDLNYFAQVQVDGPLRSVALPGSIGPSPALGARA